MCCAVRAIREIFRNCRHAGPALHGPRSRPLRFFAALFSQLRHTEKIFNGERALAVRQGRLFR